MSNHLRTKSVLACCFLLFAVYGQPAFAKQPNIVLILVDDLGYGDLACFGADDMETPELDRLMSRGLRLNQFYANCTVCSPTRAALLTGRYPDKAGVPGVIRQVAANSWGYLDPAAKTLPDYLKAAGYNTGMVGKWHLGFKKPNVPNHRGFEHFHGFLADMMDDYYTHRRGGVNWMRLNEKEIDPEGHATDLFSQWACDYIDEQSKSEQPFFLYLAYNAPHFPIQPPADWLAKVKKREPQLDDKRARNVALIEHLDHGVGRVLESLKENGVEDDTIVIFTSDNGGSIPHSQQNLPLRGGKQDHWEGGIRVPTCVVWPNEIEPQQSDTIGITMDFLPTLCDIAGAEVTDAVDGVSLKASWLDGAPSEERTLVWMRREGNRRYQGRCYYAIRRGPWKLQQSSPFEPMVLVNLEEDLFEETPQAAEGKIANELMNALQRHIQAAGRVPWQPPTSQ